MRVFLNPGHAPGGNPDPGASNRITGLRECDVAKNIADLVEKYLVAAGVDVVGNLQSDSLYKVVSTSNNLGADVFISIHCNAFNEMANGTEVWHYHTSRDSPSASSDRLLTLSARPTGEPREPFHIQITACMC